MARFGMSRAAGQGVAIGTAVFLVVSVGAASAASAATVRPGEELGGWLLVAESPDDAQLDVNAGWVPAATAGRGSVLLPPQPGVTVGLHNDDYSGLLRDITSMEVTLRTQGSGIGPRVVLRTSTPCNYSFEMPLAASWTTFDLLDAGNVLWRNEDVSGPCPALPGAGGIVNWSTLVNSLPATARLDQSVLDGAAAIRIQAGASGTSAYATTYVDSFQFNSAVSDFEPPTIKLAGATASLPAGGSITLPLGSMLSGPNQPGFGNSLGFISGNGGLTSSAKVRVSSSPAGLCAASSPTVSFAPDFALSLMAARTQVVPSLKITTKAGAGGSCTISLVSPSNATVAGSPVKLTVSRTPAASKPPTGPPTTCKATAVSKKSKIKVNMGPNLPGNGYYLFRIDVKKSAGWFRYLNSMKTHGKGETRTVNVPKGTYRVKCYGPTEAQDSRSKVVTIKK